MVKSGLSFGVLLPGREVVIYEFPIPEVLEMARIVEDEGYDSAWLGDSVLTKPRIEPLVTLAAMAMKTGKVKLGTAVYLAALRNPVLIAHSVATLDQLTRGRTILGVGIGGGRYTRELFEKEFSSCGVEFSERAGRMEESIEILRLIWTRDSVDYAGKYFSLHQVQMPVKPFQKPTIPIWIACSAADSCLRRVAKLADGWIANILKPEEFHESWGKVQTFAKECGRDVTEVHPCFYLYLNLDEDRKRSYDEADQFLTKYYNTRFTPEILERWGSFGNVKDCVKRMEDTVKAGAKSFILHFATRDPMRKLDVFTKEILPSFT